MYRNLFVFSFFLITIFANAQDLQKIRSQYPQAVGSAEVSENMFQELKNVNEDKSYILLAYKGAVTTLQAKFSKNKQDKKEFFKLGVKDLENAVNMDSLNTEIRYIRLSVQENSPKFLGYHNHIEADKKFLLENYSKISSTTLQRLIKEYVFGSKRFTQEQKANFK